MNPGDAVPARRPSVTAAAAGLAAAALFGALCLAALNAIPLAGCSVLVAGGFILLGSVAAAYRALPEDDRALLLSRRTVRSTAIASLLLAILPSCGYWYGGWLVIDDMPFELRQLMLRHWQKLDWVPSTFSLLLPSGWRSGFHQYHSGGTYCFPGPFWWESMRYLRAAIPAYTATFFAGALLARLLRMLGRRIVR